MSARSLQSDVSAGEANQSNDPRATNGDAALEDVVRLAAQICGTPVAAIMLLDAGEQVYGPVVGVELIAQPRGRTPCETTLLGDGVHEIADAYLDAVYARTGVAIGGRVFRFYAGVPVNSSSGAKIGVLFVADAVPHTLDAAQRSALAILGRQAGRQLATRMELERRERQMDAASRDRERADTELSIERTFVAAVLDTVGALVAVFDREGRIVRFNRACETVSGYTTVELAGSCVWDLLIPAGGVEEAQRQFERIRAGGFPVTFENIWLTRQGEARRIAWSATAMLDAQERVAFIIATGIDVTSQREAEATLRAGEERYRLLVEGSLGMICTHTLDGVLLSLNRNGAETIGGTVEDLVGRSLQELLPTGAATAFQAYLEEIAETGEAQGLMRLCHSDGSVRVIAYRNKLVATPGKEPYVLGFGVDVTEKVRAEAELRTLIRQSNSILESVGDGIYGLDLEGRVTVMNAAASEMLGYRQEEVLGRRMHELIHHTRADGTPNPWDECPIRESLRRLETMRVSTDVFWRKDGTSFPVDYVARPQIEAERRAQRRPGMEAEAAAVVESGSGSQTGRATPERRAVGVVVAFTDTTERRALDRMKDEFVSTVSHELRTPLTSLRAALGLIRSGTLAGRPEKGRQMLDIAMGNTDRLVRLVNDILDLERIRSGKTELHFSMCAMEDLFRGAAATRQSEATKLDIEFVIEAAGVKVWADAARVMQAISNLISNAIKVSPDGSRILLRATLAGGDDGGDGAAEAQIEVRDSGIGIPEDKLELIFDRFKQVDASDSRSVGGTGLGLAICQGIVMQHGGRIWATSIPGQGASFFFTLPTRPRGNLRG